MGRESNSAFMDAIVAVLYMSFMDAIVASSAGPSIYFFLDFLTMHLHGLCLHCLFLPELPPQLRTRCTGESGSGGTREEKVHLPKKSFCRVAQINLLAHNHMDLGTIFGEVDSRGHNKLRPELGSPTLRDALRKCLFLSR